MSFPTGNPSYMVPPPTGAPMAMPGGIPMPGAQPPAPAPGQPAAGGAQAHEVDSAIMLVAAVIDALTKKNLINDNDLRAAMEKIVNPGAPDQQDPNANKQNPTAGQDGNAGDKGGKGFPGADASKSMGGEHGKSY